MGTRQELNPLCLPKHCERGPAAHAQLAGHTDGRRPVRTSAGGSGEYYHVWFAGMPEVLKHFQQALFHVVDPISGDATRFLYTLLLTLPSVSQY